MRSRRRSDCARGTAPRISRSSSSIRAGASLRASGTTSSCSTRASPKATRCACSDASSGSATGSSSTYGRSSPPRTSIPAAMAPAMRRDADELEGFLEFLVAEISHDGLRGAVDRVLDKETTRALRVAAGDARRAPLLRRRAARAHGRRRDALPRDGAAPSAASRTTCCSPPRSCTTSGARCELGRGPVFRPTDEGRLLGHVHLGLRLIEERAAMLDPGVRAELLHAVACHHDVRAARTAEAAVLYHANQLDAVAATQARRAIERGSARAEREPRLGLRRLRRRRRRAAAARVRRRGGRRRPRGSLVVGCDRARDCARERRRAAQFAWAAFAGVVGVVGLAFFYRALAIGTMGVVGPITATAAIVPVAYGLGRGERPSTLQGVGVGLAVVGVVAASLEPPPAGAPAADRRRRRLRARGGALRSAGRSSASAALRRAASPGRCSRCARPPCRSSSCSRWSLKRRAPAPSRGWLLLDRRRASPTRARRCSTARRRRAGLLSVVARALVALPDRDRRARPRAPRRADRAAAAGRRRGRARRRRADQRRLDCEPESREAWSACPKRETM